MGAKLHAITLAAAALMISASSVSHATLIQATYEISASGFQDSNQNPPGGQTSTEVSGTYTFTFDTEIPSQLAIVPDAVVGIDVVNRLGTVVGFDESDSAVDAALNVALDLASITIGGTVSGVATIVGLTDDFGVRFEISLTDYEVDDVTADFSFVTTQDPFYSGPTTVSLVSATVVPEPSTGLLMGLGLCVLARSGARRRVPVEKPGIGSRLSETRRLAWKIPRTACNEAGKLATDGRCSKDPLSGRGSVTLGRWRPWPWGVLHGRGGAKTLARYATPSAKYAT